MPLPLLVDVDIANNALARIGEAPLVSLADETDAAAQVNAIYGDVVDVALSVYQWKWARRTEALQRLAAPAPPSLTPPATPVPAALQQAPPQVPYQGFPLPPTPAPPAPYQGFAAAPQPPTPAPVPYPNLGPTPGPLTFNGWPHAFSFPADALAGPTALYVHWPNHTCRDFAVEGKIVFARVPILYGSFVRRLCPADWPAPFRLAVTAWLAAELAVPITHDKDLAAQLLAAAIGPSSEQMRGGLIGRAIAMDVATGGGAPALGPDPVTMARFEGPWHGGSPF